jgi:hypothetical protein
VRRNENKKPKIYKKYKTCKQKAVCIKKSKKHEKVETKIQHVARFYNQKE